jgi:CubicO group peptidase (beta-lactamase class C family)
MPDAIPISGFALAPFEAAREAFAQNFADDLELGANFAVMIDGRAVVDLRGGYADRARQTPWSESTIAAIFSSGKAVLALLVAREVSRGAMRYDTPVAEYWPEFAAHGKDAITVADVMSHQAGLVGISEEMQPDEWLDWEKICRRIENQPPLYPPGSANGYSPQLFGFVLGEALRRAAGRPVRDLVREMSAARGLQLYCGLSPEEMTRAAYMRKPPAAPDLGPLNEFKEIAFLKPWSAPARVSHEDWMAAEIPASNMHADALSLARIVYPFANDGNEPDGDAVIDPAVLEEALRERISGDDLVLPFHLSWCAGLMRNINRHFGPNPSAFGHAGFGGSCVIVDPANRLSAAYVMNRMSPHLVGDPRALSLLDAVYRAL